MIERHPFGNFVPQNAQYLFLGSFTGKNVEGYDWFFSNKRNQFWLILQEVYGIDLKTKDQKQELLKMLKMAITDIILSCDRRSNSNLDTNLTNLVINTEAIIGILRNNKISAIYFSSRFAEKLYKKYFKDLVSQYPEIKLITLPSPSPRYAAMSKLEKSKRYKELLPSLL